MTLKKKATLALCGAALIASCIAGVHYYLDYVKPPAIPPRQVVERYFSAIQLQDYASAYDFVSREHYHESFNQFVDRVLMYSPLMQLEITGENITDNMAEVEAEVLIPMEFGPYSSHSRMALTRAKREWKIIHP